VASAEEAATLGPLAKDMIGYCRSGPGRLGLAAPQVGRSIGLVVTKAGDVVVNPHVYLDTSERMVTDTEGCLSLPGRVYLIERAVRCTVRGVTLDWEPLEFEAYGVEARLWQHEGDHLNGVLISSLGPEVKRR
jgi:peptide deformylase